MGICWIDSFILSRRGGAIGKELGGDPDEEKAADGADPKAKEIDFNKLCGIAVARLGISSDDFYRLDVAELYWAYKTWREGDERQSQEQYEIARFLGILIKNPKLLNRLTEVIPFSWEKGRRVVKQSVKDMKKALLSIARVQGISKTPLKKQIKKKES